jgi:hypothetical protein
VGLRLIKSSVSLNSVLRSSASSLTTRILAFVPSTSWFILIKGPGDCSRRCSKAPSRRGGHDRDDSRRGASRSTARHVTATAPVPRLLDTPQHVTTTITPLSARVEDGTFPQDEDLDGLTVETADALPAPLVPQLTLLMIPSSSGILTPLPLTIGERVLLEALMASLTSRHRPAFSLLGSFSVRQRDSSSPFFCC